MNPTIKDLQSRLSVLRAQQPLILNLTNVVTMDVMANGLLALGAAPIMSLLADEWRELITICHAVNINIGTLDSYFIKHIEFAAKESMAQKKNMVLDPVGAGASKDRTNLSARLFPYARVVRGNGSEILSLGQKLLHNKINNNKKTKGVESTAEVGTARAIAHRLSHNDKKNPKVIVVSGAIDDIICGDHHQTCHHGDKLMTKVTGMGCLLNGVIAAFVASGGKDINASTHAAVMMFNLVGQVAAQIAKTPSDFRGRLIDGLYNPDWNAIENCCESKIAPTK